MAATAARLTARPVDEPNADTMPLEFPSNRDGIGLVITPKSKNRSLG